MGYGEGRGEGHAWSTTYKYMRMVVGLYVRVRGCVHGKAN